MSEWMIVELMGRKVIAGLVREETRFGSTWMRIDVPEIAGQPGFTSYYSSSSIYGYRIVDEVTARRVAEGLREPRVEPWRLRQLAADEETSTDFEETSSHDKVYKLGMTPADADTDLAREFQSDYDVRSDDAVEVEIGIGPETKDALERAAQSVAPPADFGLCPVCHELTLTRSGFCTGPTCDYSDIPF